EAESGWFRWFARPGRAARTKTEVARWRSAPGNVNSLTENPQRPAHPRGVDAATGAGRFGVGMTPHRRRPPQHQIRLLAGIRADEREGRFSGQSPSHA